MPHNLEGRARNAIKPPKVHTTASTVKNYPALNVKRIRSSALVVLEVGSIRYGKSHIPC